MIIIFHNFFRKKLKKLTKKEQNWTKNRLKIFAKNPNDPVLNNHLVHGKYLGLRSINVSGDLRAIYKIQAKNIVFFMDIDNHANLYK